MPQDNGGPAFPRPGFDGDDKERGDWDPGNNGMTLLDYFAGQVLMGLMASEGTDFYYPDTPSGFAQRADIAYRQAAAMVFERGRREGAK